MTDELTWMVDLDEDDWPWRAHLIVADNGDWRTTACGMRVDAAIHPRGWRTWPAGELPFSGPDIIHCGVAVALMRVDAEAPPNG